MEYQSLLKKVAKLNNTSLENVDTEIRNAISQTGIKIEPMEFITLILAKTIIENENL